MFNFMNVFADERQIAGVNERALRYSDDEDTHLRTTFFVKQIEKIEIRRKALVVTVKSPDMPLIPV